MKAASLAKVREAVALLEALGMDPERTNPRSALTFMALLHMRPDDPWGEASAPMLGTRALMNWMRDEYDQDYAPNTRETIRRYTLHQFVAAGLVVENPDQPDRPVNSPRWCYQVTSQALEVVRTFGQPSFAATLAAYKEALPGLVAQYAEAREMIRIPVTLPDGRPFSLSPGGQNVLIKEMLEQFCSRFVPGGHVLYVGDADQKWALFEEHALAALGVSVGQHGKMPDLVVHQPHKDWLLLMEAASSHGPVDQTRKSELADLFRDSTAGLVFVSCFPDRAQMRKYLASIAWETEVWCAVDPTHLIHFNGERFLGPHG
jgi:type II restriction enzyme